MWPVDVLGESLAEGWRKQEVMPQLRQSPEGLLRTGEPSGCFVGAGEAGSGWGRGALMRTVRWVAEREVSRRKATVDLKRRST